MFWRLISGAALKIREFLENMIYIVSAVVVLGLLIFVHELGHFIFAKLFGVGVEKFSLGFGPKIIR